MQSVQNLGLAVVAIINGIIVDEKGYFVFVISLLAWLCGQRCVFLTTLQITSLITVSSSSQPQFFI